IINAVIGNALGHIEGIWRLMLAVCAVPAVFLFVGMLKVPESPRWLMDHGRKNKALQVLKTLRNEDRAIAELGQLMVIAEGDQKVRSAGIKEILTNQHLVRILIIGIGMAVIQQLTGINVILYYGQTVLTSSGFEGN